MPSISTKSPRTRATRRESPPRWSPAPAVPAQTRTEPPGTRRTLAGCASPECVRLSGVVSSEEPGSRGHCRRQHRPRTNAVSRPSCLAPPILHTRPSPWKLYPVETWNPLSPPPREHPFILCFAPLPSAPSSFSPLPLPATLPVLLLLLLLLALSLVPLPSSAWTAPQTGREPSVS